MKRRRNGPQIRKIQEKGDAVKRLQLSEHQGPAEELREGPGNLSGHKEGPGGGGAPQDRRTSQSSKEDPLPNRGAGKPQERTREELQEGPSREDRRDKEAQATKALGSGGEAKGRPQRDRRVAGKGLKTEEKK